MEQPQITKISRNEAARRLGVSYHTIANLGKRGKIREFQGVGLRMIKVSAEDIENYLKQKNT